MSDTEGAVASPESAVAPAAGTKPGRQALVFAVVVLVLGLAASLLIGLFATNYDPSDQSGFGQRPELLPATLHFLGGTVLGVIAIVQGIRAAVSNRGRVLGVVAVLIAAAAPVLSIICWAIVSTVVAP